MDGLIDDMNGEGVVDGGLHYEVQAKINFLGAMRGDRDADEVSFKIFGRNGFEYRVRGGEEFGRQLVVAVNPDISVKYLVNECHPGNQSEIKVCGIRDDMNVVLTHSDGEVVDFLRRERLDHIFRFTPQREDNHLFAVHVNGRPAASNMHDVLILPNNAPPVPGGWEVAVPFRN